MTVQTSMTVSLLVPPTLASTPMGEIAAWAATAGFDAIGSEPDHDAAVATTLAEHGLRLGPMRLRASLADSDTATRAAAVETARRAIDTAVTLNLKTIWTLPRNFRNDASPRANFDVAVASLREVVGYAERHGIRIAIENCPFEGQNVICTPEAWDALFAEIPSETLGLCLDPSHCIWQGIDDARVIREYAPRIYEVHAKDAEILPEGIFRYGVEGPRLEELAAADGWPRHGWWRYRLPGLGAVDWNRFLSTLADIGYHGVVSVEHEDSIWGGSPERVRRGLANARAHLRQYIPSDDSRR